MNAHCHPQRRVIGSTTSSAIRMPMLVPALMNPIPNARSFLGNHSDSVLVTAGKFGDSATPNNPRITPNPTAAPPTANPNPDAMALPNPTAPACAIDTRLQTASPSGYPIRTPTRSSIPPAINCPNAYDHANAAPMFPHCTLLMVYFSIR